MRPENAPVWNRKVEGVSARRRVADIRSALVFILQSIVVGLAVAFLVVFIRPDLMPGAGNDLPASYADAVARSAASVANIYTRRLVQESDELTNRSRFRIDTAFASAVIIDDEGYLVTNYHVFEEEPTEVAVVLSDGRIAEPEIVGFDAETDLALLRLRIPGLQPIELARSNDLRIGDVVLAIGNPYGLSTSVTQGIVSATGRNLYQLVTFANFIQTDAAINAGNSGGALVNSLGQLVGINAAVLAQDPSTEGIGFAIPVDLVRGVVDQIKQHGRVIRGYMGLLPDDLTDSERRAQGIEDGTGIILMEVYSGGPAAAADLRVGDIIVRMNDSPIYSRREALLISASTTPGDTVEVTGIRDGERFTTTVIAGERPQGIYEPAD
jgi:serine protease DegS